jgi:FeS assembly SUF system protein
MSESPTTESPVEQLQARVLESTIIEVLRTCFDPEVPINIYELGLIYGVDVQSGGKVHVKMTLTSPACPVAGTLPPEVERKVKAIDGVTEAKVDVVWDPPWSIERMSEAARLELNI